MNRVDQKRQMLRDVFQGTAEQPLLPRITVGAVMTPRPFTVTPESTAHQLVQLFHEKRFRHMLVADAGRLVGVISDRDVIRLFGSSDNLENDYLSKVTAAELMSTDLVTARPATSLAEAVALIVDNGINCLPVVDGQKPVGILTSTDLFLALEQILLSALAAPQPAA